MPPFLIEPISGRHTHRKWSAPTIDKAESVARRLSLTKVTDPDDPIPFRVVEADGTVLCQYVVGKRLEIVPRSWIDSGVS